MRSGRKKKSSTEREGEYINRSRANLIILGKMRSGKNKKSDTEKEGEYTKKSRGTGEGRRGTGAQPAGDPARTTLVT